MMKSLAYYMHEGGPHLTKLGSQEQEIIMETTSQQIESALAPSKRAHSGAASLAALCLTALLGVACADLAGPESSEGSGTWTEKADGVGSSSGSSYVDTDFGISTALGDELLLESQRWERDQLSEADEYAQPRMCAHNVSRVLETSGLPAYGDYLVPNMLNAVKVRGGLVKQLDNRDKQGFIKSMNELFQGRLPIGTLVNGCLYRDCSGEGGDGHIALLGETDSEGVVYLYHNNWYRPDNEGGERKPHMVSKAYYDDYGLRRQWMKTPWIRVHRDSETDLIIDIEGLLPAIDDLDPFTGFFITVSVMPELLAQMNELKTEQLFCPAGMSADPILGACVSGDEPDADVYGRFSDRMTKDCVERGYGAACEALHSVSADGYELELQRWSRRVYEGLRGERACPRGLKLDHDIGYCVQRAEEGSERGDEAFGPFSRELVERCQRWGGGSACASNRWSLSLLKGLL